MFHAHKRPEIDGLSKLQRVTEVMLADYKRAWKAEMMRRAMIAYLKQEGTRIPCRHLSRIVEHEEQHYAYLADSSGTLAVYRLGSKSSFKRKAKTWPKAIEVAPMYRRGIALYAMRRTDGHLDRLTEQEI